MQHRHRPGVDIHKDGLQDGCPRCAEHAEHPLRGLDTGMLHDLAARTLANRFGHVYEVAAEANLVAMDKESHRRVHAGGEPHASSFGTRVAARSDAEARAMAQVMNVLEPVGKLAETAPELLALYLRERWRLEVEISNPLAPALAELKQRLETGE